MSMSTSRTARHQRIVEILGRQSVRSQNDLLSLLAADGFEVTQATLSRDLVDVGAERVRLGKNLVYAVPGEGGDRTARPAPDGEAVSARLVAGGIYEALVTTEAGLIVAIPLLAFYNYFVHRVESFVAEIERLASDIVEKLVRENGAD